LTNGGFGQPFRMGKHYSYKQQVPGKCLRAMAGQERVHFKPMFETGRAIKGMKVNKALEFLEAVVRKERAVPFRVYNEGIPHHAQGKEWGCPSSRWPVKSCQLYIKLIKNAVAQAEEKKKKGIDINVEKLEVVHVQCNRAAQYRWRRIYQAHGRVKSYASPPTNVQIVLAEPAEIVERKE
jgi:large subunit ribosomal protein L17e